MMTRSNALSLSAAPRSPSSYSLCLLAAVGTQANASTGPLHSREMGLTRVVHVEVHLLDCIGDVGAGEGEVLDSLGQAVVDSRVADGGAHVEGDLGLSID
jgi:hypothetical protein